MTADTNTMTKENKTKEKRKRINNWELINKRGKNKRKKKNKSINLQGT